MFNANLKKLSQCPTRLEAGHRLCPGCGISVIMRQIMSVTDNPLVISNATGCFEICTGAYPYTAWNVPWIHSLFGNAASVIAGVEAMHKSLEKQGKLSGGQKKTLFMAVGGDGGTYDIGLQALSGAAERGHKFVYVCFDNEGYMNTGYQRSGATPYGAFTTTSQVGEAHTGKEQFRKDLTMIMAAHNIPYVAQSSPSNHFDLMKKADKAFKADGPAFINCLSVCPTSWKTDTQTGLKITQTAVDTCFWPLYEVENGVFKITYMPKEKLPIIAWLENQGRFKHLLKPENQHIIDALQKEVDTRWQKLIKLEEATAEDDK